MNPSSPSKYSYYALSLLLAVNLLNYVDRQIIYAVFPLIKDAFTLTDTSLGFLGSAFMVCYMLSAPALGWLGDRTSRVKLASAGLAFWSVATSLSGLAARYHSLLLARVSVGIGEASFGTVSPGLLSDYFPKEKRGRILSYFYLAIPVGSAFGYLLGGILGEKFGWQAAFLIVGLPGVLLAIPVWLLHEPERGATEEKVSCGRNPETDGLCVSIFQSSLYHQYHGHDCHDLCNGRFGAVGSHFSLPYSRARFGHSKYIFWRHNGTCRYRGHACRRLAGRLSAGEDEQGVPSGIRLGLCDRSAIGSLCPGHSFSCYLSCGDVFRGILLVPEYGSPQYCNNQCDCSCSSRTGFCS